MLFVAIRLRRSVQDATESFTVARIIKGMTGSAGTKRSADAMRFEALHYNRRA